MNRRESRRINPIAHLTACVVTVLVLFEISIILGVLELEAQTVAKYAPWAYEPFLRLVGEHPESAPRRAAVEESGEGDTAGSAVVEAAGIELSVIPLLTETNSAGVSTNADYEALQSIKDNPEADAAESPDDSDETRPEEIEPVG